MTEIVEVVEESRIIVADKTPGLIEIVERGPAGPPGPADPVTDDGDTLGTASKRWSDLFLAPGGVINWGAGDVVITHSTNNLAFTGAGASGYDFDNGITLGSAVAASATDLSRHLALWGSTYGFSVTDSTLNYVAGGFHDFLIGGTLEARLGSTGFLPGSNDGGALGVSGTAWSDLFLADGAVVNFNAGNYTLTHSTGLLAASGSLTIGGSSTIGGSFALTGDITPSQITADQNDYSPTGLSTASVLRLSSDATRTITGLAGGADGRLILIHNVGSQPIILDDDSSASTAANRFALSGDVALQPDESTLLQYDSTASRWRVIGGVGSGGSGGVSITVSPTAPALPADGDLWYDTEDAIMYIYLDDGSSSQWVETAPAGGGDAITTDTLAQFAATTSAQLRGVISDETGTGALVFGTSPTLTTSALLSSGFVFNWNSSDVTLTHATDNLTMAGGSFLVNWGDGSISSRAVSSTSFTTVDAQSIDYLSGLTFTATRLLQYSTSGSGTTLGISNAALGSLVFQNCNNALIYTNGNTDITFGTVSAPRMVLDTSGRLKPYTNDGAPLGQSGTAWSDLFLASGSVINWNAGDVTLTHASNALYIEGGSVSIGQQSTARRLVVGSGTGIEALRITGGGGTDNGAFISFANNTTENNAIGHYSGIFGGAYNGALTYYGASGSGHIWTIGGTSVWSINASGHFVPGANATYDIGSSSVGVNDLFFGSGGVINFNNGDVTLTHSSNLLTLDGGDFLATGNDRTISSRAGTTAGASVVDVQASDYTTNFGATRLIQYGSTASGAQITGTNRASLGILIFQNCSAGLIYTNGAADLIFGTVSAERMRIGSGAGGVMIGAPTGGDKGTGSLNVAADIYRNNSAYANPDYVLEHYYTGKIEKFAQNEGADTYPGLMPLGELETYLRENHHLPRVPRNGGAGIFARSDFVLEKLEELFLHIIELEKRLAHLEGRH